MTDNPTHDPSGAVELKEPGKWLIQILEHFLSLSITILTNCLVSDQTSTSNVMIRSMTSRIRRQDFQVLLETLTFFAKLSVLRIRLKNVYSENLYKSRYAPHVDSAVNRLVSTSPDLEDLCMDLLPASDESLRSLSRLTKLRCLTFFSTTRSFTRAGIIRLIKCSAGTGQRLENVTIGGLKKTHRPKCT